MNASIGVVVALVAEARALGLSRPRPGHDARRLPPLRVAVSGIGADAAGRAASELADTGVAALMSFGTAGGLDPALSAGDLVCPERVVDEDARWYPCDRAWRERLQASLERRLAAGPIISVRRPLLDAAAKQATRAGSGAVAVDMESAAIAAVAQRRGLPFLALRAVLDDAQARLPSAVMTSVDAWGRPQPWALLLALLRSPRQLTQLPGLARAFGRAERSLAQVCASTVNFAWTLP